MRTEKDCPGFTPQKARPPDKDSLRRTALKVNIATEESLLSEAYTLSSAVITM